jgi:hypothetical protein
VRKIDPGGVEWSCTHYTFVPYGWACAHPSLAERSLGHKSCVRPAGLAHRDYGVTKNGSFGNPAS